MIDCEIREQVALLGNAIRTDNDNAAFDAVLPLVAQALVDLNRIANALETIAARGPAVVASPLF